MPIYVGGSAPAVIERAVQLGDGFFPPGMPTGWNRYRRRCIELGRPDPGEWPRRGPVFLWVTDQPKDGVWERLAPHVRHQIEHLRGRIGQNLGFAVAGHRRLSVTRHRARW